MTDEQDRAPWSDRPRLFEKAIMLLNEDRTQGDVAEILNISQATVQRMRAKWIKAGCPPIERQEKFEPKEVSILPQGVSK